MASLEQPSRSAGLVLSAADDAGAAARAVVRFHLRALAHEEGPARSGDVEGIHQLRVATRRLRASFRLFEPLLPRSVTKIPDQLAWLGTAIGAVRDLDVLGVTARARAAKIDSALRAALGPLGVAIHDARAEALAGLVETLDSTRCRTLFDRIAVFGESAPPARHRLLGEVAPGLVRPLVTSVLRASRRLGDDPSPEALHRLRVRAKRARYALEALRALGGKRTRKTIRRLENLQDILGEHQDAVTAIAWLRRYAERPDVPPATILAAGAMIAGLGRRAEKRRRRLTRARRRLDRRRLAAEIAAEIGSAPARPPALRLVRAAS